MTHQAIPLESISVEDLQNIFSLTSSMKNSSGDANAPLKESSHSFDEFDSEEINEILAGMAVKVVLTDSDSRLDFLQSINPSLTEEYLEEIATTTDLWLDEPARERIRSLAWHTYDAGEDPRTILQQFNTVEELKRLVDLLLESPIPDKTLAICYAVSVAYDATFASFFIHENRSSDRSDLSQFEQTPEETAADLRFVNYR